MQVSISGSNTPGSTGMKDGGMFFFFFFLLTGQISKAIGTYLVTQAPSGKIHRGRIDPPRVGKIDRNLTSHIMG